MANLFTAVCMLSCCSGILARVNFEGESSFAVPFHPSRTGFVKRSYITFASSTTKVNLKCETSFDGGAVSIFKGPWSNPTILVDRGNPVTSNASFFFNRTSATYQIGINEVTLEDSGTYFCFWTESISDLEIIDQVSFSELLVQSRFTLFCVMQSYTDSIFLSNLTEPIVCCITFSEELRNPMENTGLYLSKTTEDGRTRITETTASPFSSLEIPSVPPLGEIIYEIPVDNLRDINMSMVTCERRESSNLCTNIQPLLLYSELEVTVHPQKVKLHEKSASLEFVCMTVPNIAGKVVWKLSKEKTVPYASPTVRRTADGSKLILNDIDSSHVEDGNFEVTCAVSFGDAKEVKSSSMVVISSGSQNNPGHGGIICTWYLLIFAFINLF